MHQTDCPWSCRVSYKNAGKRGSGERAYILTVKSLSHNDTHSLAPNPLTYKRHRDRLEEYQKLVASARTHRTSVLPYVLSWRVLDAMDGTGLSLTRREYYNLKRNQCPNKKDDKSIDGLLYALDDVGFTHACRTDNEEDVSGKIVSRKLV